VNCDLFLSPIKAASSPLEAGPVPLKQEALEDASTWSVDDVILFLKRADPQMSGSLTNLMKQHVMYLLILFFLLP
jgi:hypothetical protein